MERVHEYHVEPVPRHLMADFAAAHHYAVRVPPHCLLPLGCFVDSDPSAGSGQALVGVASWAEGPTMRSRYAADWAGTEAR